MGGLATRRILRSLTLYELPVFTIVSSRERLNYSPGRLARLSPGAFLSALVSRCNRIRKPVTSIDIKLRPTMDPLDLWMQRFNPIPIDAELSTDAKELRLKPTFHPFPRLPAEIRVKIWAIALQDQYLERPCDEDTDRMIVWVENSVTLIMSQNGFYVVPSRGYPTHFFVNREARAEAARCDGGVWLPFDDGAVEVYVNFDKEDVRLHDSRAGALNDSLWSTGAWGILAKEALCREIIPVTREYGGTIMTSHWVGHKRAGETT